MSLFSGPRRWAVRGGRSRRGAPVVVLERAAEPGRKILISGGGRCNFTNIYCAREFSVRQPALRAIGAGAYTPADFIALVERHRIRYHEKTLECSSATARRLRSSRCCWPSARRRASRSSPAAMSAVCPPGSPSRRHAGARRAAPHRRHRRPLDSEDRRDDPATASRDFGIAVVPPRPALVPLVFDGDDRARWTDLAGVAATVDASANGVTFRERLLVTHRGLSGPAVLQASSYWQPVRPWRSTSCRTSISCASCPSARGRRHSDDEDRDGRVVAAPLRGSMVRGDGVAVGDRRDGERRALRAVSRSPRLACAPRGH